MLADSMVGTADVAGTILASVAAPAAGKGPKLSLDPADMGKILMGTGDGGDDVVLVAHNPMATARTEMVSIPIPVCAVDVTNADTGAAVVSQVTANFRIGDGTAPYYDFELHFEAISLPALGFQRFRISPKPDGQCGGSDAASGAADATTYVRHEQRHPIQPSAAPRNRAGGPEVVKEAIRRQGEVCGDPDRWEKILAEVQAEMVQDQQQPPLDQAAQDAARFAVMENNFMKVYVDLRKGVQAVYDKGTGENRTLTHDLIKYTTQAGGDPGAAYVFQPTGPAVPLLATPSQPVYNCTSWRQTAGCDPNGQHQPKLDASCSAPIQGKQSGYCDCGGYARNAVGCDLGRVNFTCSDICSSPGGQPIDIEASSVALGPVMQEVRLQVSDQHKTRIRLWVSDDPEVGGRIEFGNRIGVLTIQTEIASRFGIGAPSAGTENMTFFSEDNGYEAIPHPREGDENVAGSIATHYYPSQQSCFMANSSTQLSVALDRSHAVGSLIPGTLDVVQHRRGGPYTGSGETVVLDDVDRIFTQVWVAVGNKTAANRGRISMKQRLNHPLILAAGTVPKKAASVPPLTASGKAAAAGIADLPAPVHLQSLRATNAAGTELLLRLQHMFTVGEDSKHSVPQAVDVAKLLSAVRPVKSVAEVTLDGMKDVASLANRTRYPAAAADSSAEQRTERAVVSATSGTTDVLPFELRTFKLQ